MFRNYNTVPTAFENMLVDTIGHLASGFITAGNTFTIPVSTVAYVDVGLGTDIYVFIPKNNVSFGIRFSCTQTSTTNGLFPIHS
jgi:hypothetical protein